ncbi:MAG: hypothetical protein ACXVW1_13930 [Nocardioides sp.]
MPRTPATLGSLVASALKPVLLAGLLALGIVLGTSIGSADPATPAARPHPATRVPAAGARASAPDDSAHLLVLMQRHRCSAQGYGPSVVPASALVRSAAGRLRMVSFEQGWSVYAGKAPGTLVAVCLDPFGPSRD